MHSSRCIPITSSVPTIWLPRFGAQIPVAAGAPTQSGLSGHRNFAVWIMLDSPDVAVAAGKQNVVLASLAFQHPGKPSMIVNVSLGSPPWARILMNDDWIDIAITSPSATLVWLEDLSTQTRCDP